jgi:hypothetical protein
MRSRPLLTTVLLVVLVLFAFPLEWSFLATGAHSSNPWLTYGFLGFAGGRADHGLLWNLLGVSSMREWDWRCLELLAGSGAVALALFKVRGTGLVRSGIGTLAVLSAEMLPLSVWVALFDYGQMNVSFSLTAIDIGLGWITNATIGEASGAILAVSLLLLKIGAGKSATSRRQAAT